MVLSVAVWFSVSLCLCGEWLYFIFYNRLPQRHRGTEDYTATERTATATATALPQRRRGAENHTATERTAHRFTAFILCLFLALVASFGGRGQVFFAACDFRARALCALIVPEKSHSAQNTCPLSPNDSVYPLRTPLAAFVVSSNIRHPGGGACAAP